MVTCTHFKKDKQIRGKVALLIYLMHAKVKPRQTISRTYPISQVQDEKSKKY